MGLVQVGGGQGQCDQFLNVHYPEKRGRFENVLRGEWGRGRRGVRSGMAPWPHRKKNLEGGRNNVYLGRELSLQLSKEVVHFLSAVFVN